MRLSSAFALSLFLMTGFFVFAQSGATLVDSIKVQGIYRRYRIYIPPTYSSLKPAPLVFNLHGLNSNASQQQVYGNFMPVADTAGFLVVHPEGTVSGLIQFWNAGLMTGSDDVLWLSNLSDTLQAKYAVDENRVYMCGLSNGGIMSYYFACEQPGKLAAIASVAGTMFRPFFFTCAPPFALPVMEIHGTDDSTIPYDGNNTPGTPGAFIAIDSVIAKWVARNACSAPSTFTLADISPSDGSTVTNSRYLSGTDGSAVELYKVQGGSHSWPGAINVIPGTNQDFNASAEIWRFFRQFNKSRFTQPVGVEKNSSKQFRLYPNPCNGLLFIEGANVSSIIVNNSLGQQFACPLVYSGIDVSGLEPGIYFLEIISGNEKERIRFIRN